MKIVAPRKKVVRYVVYCGFCGKSEDEVRKLFAGGNHVAICGDCVDMAHEKLHHSNVQEGKVRFTVTERLYKRLYEIKNSGADPEAIYLGNDLMNELHEVCRTFRGDLIYGDKPNEWSGLPVFEVVGHPDHLFIAQKPYIAPCRSQ